MTISINLLYDLVGVILAITAVMTLTDKTHPRRYTSALFWALYAALFLVGQWVPPEWVGVGVIVMALIAGFGGVGSGVHKLPSVEQYVASAKRLGHSLFIPALAIPLLTMVGTLSKE